MENLENEVLQKIKFALLCKNEAIAIRLLEQYRFDVTEEMYSKEDVARLGAKWQQEQDRWKTVSEKTPPNNVELLVQSPEGVVHLSNWRESYNIFTCQTKSESSYDWKWKTI